MVKMKREVEKMCRSAAELQLFFITFKLLETRNVSKYNDFVLRLFNELPGVWKSHLLLHLLKYTFRYIMGTWPKLIVSLCHFCRLQMTKLYRKVEVKCGK